jgi:hypothetical protein
LMASSCSWSMQANVCASAWPDKKIKIKFTKTIHFYNNVVIGSTSSGTTKSLKSWKVIFWKYLMEIRRLWKCFLCLLRLLDIRVRIRTEPCLLPSCPGWPEDRNWPGSWRISGLKFLRLTLDHEEKGFWKHVKHRISFKLFNCLFANTVF